ncbi:MAG: DUF4249 family protein [Saprospiraceae bacterium]|nr:DUF4249 family protein [Saprospiraceae bacterium]
MRNRIIQLSCLLGWLLITTSCEDEIMLEPVSDTNTNVVINGKLVRGEQNYIFVQVTQFRGVDIFSSSGPIRADEVRLVNQSTGEVKIVPANVDKKGYYLVLEPREVNYSHEYILEVDLGNGRSYVSMPQQLYTVPEIEDLSYTLAKRSGVRSDGIPFEQSIINYEVVTKLARPDREANARLIWQMDATFQLSQNPSNAFGIVCYLSANEVSKDFPVLDGTNLQFDPLQTIRQTILTDIINFKYAEGFLLRVNQESLSMEAFNYFEQVSKLINRSGTISEDPAGEIIGNIRNSNNPDEKVYGLFYAVDQDTRELFVRPGEVGNPNFYCPQPTLGLGAPEVTLCTDCEAAWRDGPVSFMPPLGWGG